MSGQRSPFAAVLMRRDALLLGIILAAAAAVGFGDHRFLGAANLRDIASGAAPGAIAAIGVALVVLTGEIDISIGALFGFLAALLGILSSPSRCGMDPVPAVLLTILAGTAIGAVNGFISTYCRCPSIITTLGTMTLLTGATELLLGGDWIVDLPAGVRAFAQMRPLGVPMAPWAALLLLIGAQILVERTRIGLRFRAVGSNATAAALAGVPVERTRLIAFTLSGLATAIAVVTAVPALSVIDSGLGRGMELFVVTAVVLGGVSIRGGSGRPSGAFVATILLAMVRTSLIFMKLGDGATYWERAVFGTMILVAVLADRRAPVPPAPIIETDAVRRARIGMVRAGVATVLACGFFAWIDPAFIDPHTQLGLAANAAELLMIAAPSALLMMAGGIDLSIGANMALSSVIFGLVYRKTGNVSSAGEVMVISGMCMGLANGVLVTTARVHPLIVTLATMSIFRGVAEGLTNGTALTQLPSAVTDLADDAVFGVTHVVLLAAFAFIGVAILAYRTALGRNARAAGFNARAAHHAGVDVVGSVRTLYVLNGVFAALTAFLFMARRHTAKADIGQGFELEVITAVILGGVSVAGGRGSLPGAFLGVLFLHELRQGVAWHWAKDEIILIVLGLTLILGVLVENRFDRLVAFLRRRS